MKKLKCAIFLLLATILCSTQFQPTNVQALDIIYEEDCYEGGYETGPISIAPAVDKIFSQFEYLMIDLYNVEEQYIVEEVLVDYEESYKYDTVLPVGTYVLLDVYFEDFASNKKFSMTPEQIVVTPNGVEGTTDNIVWINVNYEQYETVPVTNRVIVNDGKSFDGYVNMTYYNKTDTVFRDDNEKQVIELTHVSAAQKKYIDTKVSAGEACISNMNVYDKNKEPLNVYYQPNFFELQRNLAYEDGYVKEHNVYIFSDESELSKDVLEKVKNPENGYILKTSEEMRPYEELENETFIIVDGKSEFETVLDGDIPKGEPGYVANEVEDVEDVVEDETIEMEEDAVVEDVDTDTEKKSFIKNHMTLVFGIVTAIVVVVIVVIMFKKRKY